MSKKYQIRPIPVEVVQWHIGDPSPFGLEIQKSGNTPSQRYLATAGKPIHLGSRGCDTHRSIENGDYVVKFPATDANLEYIERFTPSEFEAKFMEVDR